MPVQGVPKLTVYFSPSQAAASDSDHSIVWSHVDRSHVINPYDYGVTIEGTIYGDIYKYKTIEKFNKVNLWICNFVFSNATMGQSNCW